MGDVLDKQHRLDTLLQSVDRALVALSGGVDSALIAVRAHQLLGDRALSVTGVSPSYSAHQRSLVDKLVGRFGLHHRFIETHEIEDAAYRANDTDRCFHCKNELYQTLGTMGRQLGFDVVLDGANADDRSDYRPGRQAARQLGVRSPLDEADLSKQDIREMAKRLQIPVWEEPASACLASRIPYQTPVTIQKLSDVERAEDVLRTLGFRDNRVRHHGDLARIELPADEIARAASPSLNKRIVNELKALGFLYVSLDLEGYRRGSLNEALSVTTDVSPVRPDP